MPDKQNMVRPKRWFWCDGCGNRVYVNRAQSWRAARPHCMACGCTRLTQEKPTNAKE